MVSVGPSAVGVSERHTELHVVVGFPSSDIGKGWTAAALGVRLGADTAMIKIDPMLSPDFPADIGSVVDGSVVTDDAATYLSRGLKFSADMNIVMGRWLAGALGLTPLESGRLDDNPLKNTFVDLGYRLADDLAALAGGRDAVVEIGGCPDDDEAGLVTHAVRVLLGRYRDRLFVHVVTELDPATDRDGPTFKIRTAVRAVRTVLRTYYGVPLWNVRVWVRRASVPGSFTDEQLRAAMVPIAFKLGLAADQVRYVPNVARPEDLDQVVGETEGI